MLHDHAGICTLVLIAQFSQIASVLLWLCHFAAILVCMTNLLASHLDELTNMYILTHCNVHKYEIKHSLSLCMHAL